MTKDLISRKSRSTPAHVAVFVVIGALLSWYSFTTGAEEQTSAPASTESLAPAGRRADLERAFWLCDYAGTKGGVDTGTAMACSTITEELKNNYFHSDFDALVSWWQKNKPAEHQALEAASSATASMETAALTTQ